MTTDIRMTQNENLIWDISLDENGDIENGDFLDSSLDYAILGERRANESEVFISENRRGWIGNEGKDFENGSKLWLFSQAKITRTILNDIQETALDAISYLVEDNYATSVDTKVTLVNGVVVLELTITVTPSQVSTRYYNLWKNTGR